MTASPPSNDPPGDPGESPAGALAEKRALVRRLREHLDNDIAALSRAQADAMAAATHEEAKPENDKDTRAIEASYLARGQAERVRTLEDERNALEFMPLRAFKSGDAIALGALIDAEVDGEEAHYFLAPCAGGIKVTNVQIITPASPLGRVFVGKREGDSTELASTVRGRPPREIEITGVR